MIHYDKIPFNYNMSHLFYHYYVNVVETPTII